MIRRLLMLLATLLAASWWMRRKQATRSKAPEPREPPVLSGGLVRDRVCNTYLPRERAMVLEVAGEELFFCSERCLDRYQETEKAASHV